MTQFKVCAEDFPQIILSLIFLKLNNCKGNSEVIYWSIAVSVFNAVLAVLSVVVAGKVNEKFDWLDEKLNGWFGGFCPCFKYNRATTKMFVFDDESVRYEG